MAADACVMRRTIRGVGTTPFSSHQPGVFKVQLITPAAEGGRCDNHSQRNNSLEEEGQEDRGSMHELSNVMETASEYQNITCKHVWGRCIAVHRLAGEGFRNINVQGGFKNLFSYLEVQDKGI